MSDLKAIRLRDAQITHHNLPPMRLRNPDPFAAQALRDMAIEGAHDRRDLLAAIDQVLALHRPSTDHRAGFDPYCVGCWEAGGEDGAPAYPCATARALGVTA